MLWYPQKLWKSSVLTQIIWDLIDSWLRFGWFLIDIFCSISSQVFVANSYKNSDVGHPFGYLKASTNLSTVNLFVMPYNYPALLPLIDDFFKVHRMKVTPEWRGNFQKYIGTMPSYYAAVSIS
jgi:hypothetical protein